MYIIFLMKRTFFGRTAINRVFIIFSIIVIFSSYLPACKALTSEKLAQKNVFIYNGNDPSANNLEISLTSLTNPSDVLKLSLQLNITIRDIKTNRFYLARSPQQITGGYEFIIQKVGGQAYICLKKPKDTDSALMALSNPFALIEADPNIEVSMTISYCNNI